MRRVLNWGDVEDLKSSGNLVLVINGNVYCIDDAFLHPGGTQVSVICHRGSLVCNIKQKRCHFLHHNESAHTTLQILHIHSGKDVTHLFNGIGNSGYPHSSAAHELLTKYLIGPLGSPALTSPHHTEQHHPYTTTTYPIDEYKPLLCQVGSMGPFYMEWVHRPVTGQPRFFHSNWAEAVTKVRWWVVPLIWLPLIAYTFYRSILQFQERISYITSHSNITHIDSSSSRPTTTVGFYSYKSKRGSSSSSDALLFPLPMAMVEPMLNVFPYFLLGMVAWQFMEYSLHRFLFHREPTTPRLIFLHFLLHGCHHKYPMDTERLVFPPVPASWVIATIYCGLHAVLQGYIASAIFCGMLFGYVAYDCMHFAMHSGWLGGRLKEAHMRHHFIDPGSGYGISSPLFDYILGTKSKPLNDQNIVEEKKA